MTTTNIDRQWFKCHNDRNFRIRAGAPGEVLDLMRRSVRALGRELPANDCLPDIGAAQEWRICVIRLDLRTLARLPVVRAKGSSDEIGELGDSTMAAMVLLGDNLVMDRIAG